ncbi:phosphatidylserine decarboxylase protein [Rutstroemia sp. NJR-2017a BVV2]|nr:phosphatidylserine decarboxylase protein [Rutstroemia sp. NJR-2017a BVV2]
MHRATGLDTAEWMNAHSMTLAVRGIVELFQLVGRETEVQRERVAFSIAHDDRMGTIHGHYPVFEGKEIKYYFHAIRAFDFTTMEGRDRWTAYRFTKNVYDVWMPRHFERLCSAVDQIPADLDLGAAQLSQGEKE